MSDQVLAIFREVTPLVEPLSLDEAYLDVTENAWGEPLGVNVARRIKERIREETSLTASAGVAPNKFLAKIASGWQKPDGLTVVAPERVERFLAALPVDALWGVGPVTARKLRGAGIQRVVELRDFDPERLRELLGSSADYLRELAFGHDNRPVVPEWEPKSCSSERTYQKDLTDLRRMREEVNRMARDAAEWLTEKGIYARTVTIKVRYADFTTVTRNHSRQPATRDADEIAARAVALLDRTAAASRPVRLLGAGVHGLTDTPSAPAEPRPATGLLPFHDE